MDETTGKPHAASLAVWAAQPTVVASEQFTLKVGAKCSEGCNLGGRHIYVFDAAGAVVASGQTGATPWPETAALYWTELTLRAPGDEGQAVWSARLDDAARSPLHECAAGSISVAIVKPPEHTLTVKVIAKGTAAPIPEAEIRLGACRARTGASGLAEIRVGKGHYALQVWKAGYATPETAVDIRSDAFIEVAALEVPEEDPDARWTA